MIVEQMPKVCAQIIYNINNELNQPILEQTV